MTGTLLAVIGSAAQQSGGGSGFHVVAAPAVAASITAVSPSVTATASGGTPAYTYQWSIKSGAGVYASSPTSAATTFYCGGSTARTATAICSVQDSTGATAVSNDVQIDLLQDGGGEGNN